jgi:predicted negative regulator of RcsB-dependent stress response
LAGLGRFPEAEKLASETLAIHRRIASTHEGTARTLLILGRVKVEKGEFEEAGKILSEALDLFREHSPSRREQIALTANWLGAVKVARQTYADAEKLLLTETEQFFAPAVQMSNAERRAAVGHIVQLYESWMKSEEAATWKRRLDEIPDRSAK